MAKVNVAYLTGATAVNAAVAHVDSLFLVSDLLIPFRHDSILSADRICASTTAAEWAALETANKTNKHIHTQPNIYQHMHTRAPWVNQIIILLTSMTHVRVVVVVVVVVAAAAAAVLELPRLPPRHCWPAAAIVAAFVAVCYRIRPRVRHCGTGINKLQFRPSNSTVLQFPKARLEWLSLPVINGQGEGRPTAAAATTITTAAATASATATT
jgi:hypothetical protein